MLVLRISTWEFLLTNWLDSLVSGTYWGQVAVNHLRERVNMTHVVLSIPAIATAAIVVGIPLNWLLGNALDSWGDRVPGAIKLTNIAR